MSTERKNRLIFKILQTMWIVSLIAGLSVLLTERLRHSVAGSVSTIILAILSVLCSATKICYKEESEECLSKLFPYAIIILSAMVILLKPDIPNTMILLITTATVTITLYLKQMISHKHVAIFGSVAIITTAMFVIGASKTMTLLWYSPEISILIKAGLFIPVIVAFFVLSIKANDYPQFWHLEVQALALASFFIVNTAIKTIIVLFSKWEWSWFSLKIDFCVCVMFFIACLVQFIWLRKTINFKKIAKLISKKHFAKWDYDSQTIVIQAQNFYQANVHFEEDTSIILSIYMTDAENINSCPQGWVIYDDEGVASYEERIETKRGVKAATLSNIITEQIQNLERNIKNEQTVDRDN